MARSLTLTPDLIDQIAQLVKAGNYWNAAAAAVGVPERTLHDWIAKGRAAQLDPTDTDCPTCGAKGDDGCLTKSGARMGRTHAQRPRQTDPDDLCVRFVQALTRAENENHAQLVAAWKGQARTDWRAAKELLARRHPNEWADRTRHELSGSITVDVESLDARIESLLDDGQDGP